LRWEMCKMILKRKGEEKLIKRWTAEKNEK
jgi:hypothetical protein